MKQKNQIRGIIILAIVFVAFTVLVFAIPFAKTLVFWLAYLFTVIAILAQGYIFHSAFNKGEPVKSKLYGFPIARIGFIYLVVQLVLGIIFMAVAGFAPAWLAAIIFVLVLAAAGVGFISADIMRNEVEQQDVQLKKDVTAMRALQSKAAFMATQCADPDTKLTLQKFSEALRYSDPVSGDALTEVEAGLAALVDELQAAVIDGDYASASALCAKAQSALAERNRLCKLSK